MDILAKALVERCLYVVKLLKEIKILNTMKIEFWKCNSIASFFIEPIEHRNIFGTKRDVKRDNPHSRG